MPMPPLDITEIHSSFTVDGLAEFLNMSPRSVRRLLAGPEPQIESFKIGRERRILQRAVIDYVDRNRTRAGKRKSA